MYNISFEQLRQGELQPVFALLEVELTALGIDFYLIGAIARDVWLTALAGIDPKRITKDLDVAVLVADEAQYRLLKDRLLASGRFSASRGNAYTLLFEDGRPIDLMPFGGLAMEGAVQIAGQGLTTIQVDGFREVYEAGTASVDINSQAYQVCTLTGIVVLKLIAYDDRPDERPKDWQDIGFILQHYFDLVEEDIYEHHLDLFDDPDFTTERAAARVMGRQMQGIVNRSDKLRERIEGILFSHLQAGERSRAAEWMVRGTKQTISDALSRIDQLHKGLTDPINRP